MEHGLHDLVRHNTWANAQVITFCQQLNIEALDTTSPGTYGSIIQTMQHTIDSEGSYVYRLTGAWPQHPWKDDEFVGLDVLLQRSTILGETLETFLAGDWSSEQLGKAYGDNGDVFAVPAGIFLTQIFHHGNEHRAQICTILGALGIEPPDVSAWGYADASGRSTLTNPAPRAE